MAFASIDEGRLFYRDLGGDGPPLVFSHGLLMDHTMWQPQIAALRDRWRCITYDERCHGETETINGHFTYWKLANDLAALLDHLEIERAAFVGMSQGGFISLRFAILHPDRTAGLVLIDTQAGIEDRDKVDTYRTMLEFWEEEGLNEVTAEMIAAIILGQDFPGRGEWIEKWKRAPVNYIRPAWDCLVEREDIHDRLHEISAPALVIHGEQDAAIPADLADRLASSLPNGRGPMFIPRAGHASNLAQPELVNAAIVEFLTDHVRWGNPV